MKLRYTLLACALFAAVAETFAYHNYYNNGYGYHYPRRVYYGNGNCPTCVKNTCATCARQEGCATCNRGCPTCPARRYFAGDRGWQYYEAEGNDMKADYPEVMDEEIVTTPETTIGAVPK